MGVITTPQIKKIQSIANSFADSKIDLMTKELEESLKTSTGKPVWSRAMSSKVLGKYLSLAYALGVIDQKEKNFL
jgi:hypothetical protein